MKESKEISDQLELDENNKILLQQFRNVVSDILQPHHDDYFLHRFLAARDYDLRNAETMIRESFKFKKKIEAENILDSGIEASEVAKVFQTYCATTFVCFDKEGSLVRTCHAGVCDFKGLAHSYTIVDLIKNVMFILEEDISKCKERQKNNMKYSDKSTYIIDLHDLSLRQFCDKTVFHAGCTLISMYQDNYPESLKVAYMIRAPKYFSWIFNLFKPFIDPKTLSKIRIYSNDDWKTSAFKNVDPQSLPINFGGVLENPYKDPQTVQKLKVPTKFYLKGNLSLKESDPNIKPLIVPKRSFTDIQLTVKKPGTLLKWVFQVHDYNIKFGVFFRSANSLDKKKMPPEEVVPIDLVEAQTIPERGELKSEKAGIYLLRFDNTYSWMTSKHVLYKVETQLPLAEIIEE